jgi:hypothetical protein
MEEKYMKNRGEEEYKNLKRSILKTLPSNPFNL